MPQLLLYPVVVLLHVLDHAVVLFLALKPHLLLSRQHLEQLLYQGVLWRGHCCCDLCDPLGVRQERHDLLDALWVLERLEGHDHLLGFGELAVQVADLLAQVGNLRGKDFYDLRRNLRSRLRSSLCVEVAKELLLFGLRSGRLLIDCAERRS